MPVYKTIPFMRQRIKNTTFVPILLSIIPKGFKTTIAAAHTKIMAGIIFTVSYTHLTLPTTMLV